MDKAVKILESINSQAKIVTTSFSEIEPDIFFERRNCKLEIGENKEKEDLLANDLHLNLDNCVFKFSSEVIFEIDKLDFEIGDFLWGEKGVGIERIKGLFRSSLNGHKWTIQG